MLFTFVLLAGTIPGEESSPYVHSKAQRVSGSSCNQKGKMDCFHSLLSLPHERALEGTFLPLHCSLCQGIRETSLGRQTPWENKEESQPSPLRMGLKVLSRDGSPVPLLVSESWPFPVTQGSESSPEVFRPLEKAAVAKGMLVFHALVPFQRPWKIAGALSSQLCTHILCWCYSQLPPASPCPWPREGKERIADPILNWLSPLTNKPCFVQPHNWFKPMPCGKACSLAQPLGLGSVLGCLSTELSLLKMGTGAVHQRALVVGVAFHNSCFQGCGKDNRSWIPSVVLGCDSWEQKGALFLVSHCL